MMNKGLFFDLDGTLVNTHESNASAYYQAIVDVLGEQRVNRDALYAEIAGGKNCRDFLRTLISDIDDGTIDAIARRKAQLYPDHLDASELNEDLVHFIREEKDAGTVITLVTTAKRTNALNVLRYHGIEDLFDFMVFGDDVDALKPAPDIYLRALQVSGIDHPYAEAFEDSAAGIQAASNAGIRVHRVDWAI